MAKIGPKKRFEVLKRCGFQCTYCGQKPPDVTLEVDHRASRVAGGSEDDDDNLTAACRECNIGKGPTSDQNDEGIVIVRGSDGQIDHERSLKLSGLWSSITKEVREQLTAPLPPTPLEIILLDLSRAERAALESERILDEVRKRVAEARLREHMD